MQCSYGCTSLDCDTTHPVSLLLHVAGTHQAAVHQQQVAGGGPSAGSHQEQQHHDSSSGHSSPAGGRRHLPSSLFQAAAKPPKEAAGGEVRAGQEAASKAGPAAGEPGLCSRAAVIQRVGPVLLGGPPVPDPGQQASPAGRAQRRADHRHQRVQVYMLVSTE